MNIKFFKVVGLIIFLNTSHLCLAQLGGARAGVFSQSQNGQSSIVVGELRSEAVSKYIMVKGSAETRIDPSRIRIVLAVTAEADTPIGCREIIADKVTALTTAWSSIEIPDQDIDEDFISILPVYEWKIDGKIAAETNTGHRMQTNLNIAVANEAKAKEVLDKAFNEGVTDIIAFDYWSEKIEQQKADTLLKAIEAAKAKAATLFSIFDEKPAPINITEDTKTVLPSQLYQSFKNSYESQTDKPYRKDLTFISAFRPKNTYYKGLQVEVDSSESELALSRQISVVSTVRIYYQSPAKIDKETGGDKAEESTE